MKEGTMEEEKGLGSKEGTSNTTTLPSSAASTVKSINNNKENNRKNKAMAQYNADARLLAVFEQSGESGGKSFNYYTKSVQSTPESVSQEQMSAYLTRIQRGGLIQSFGCMVAIEDLNFIIIAYSENAIDMLGVGRNQGVDDEPRSLLGLDARTLFTHGSGASLAKAASSRELTLLNPIWVYSIDGQRPFYAILHRIDVGIVIDLEPARLGDPAFSIAGAVQSQKLAIRAISRLQSLPGGDIGVLCDTVVENVQELTGYDRVMVYKFHEDEHGEVLSEVRRSDLEPYLGLHYPATDIPQAARFLFKQNRVRMICDCHSNPVGIVQSEELLQPLCLVNSTLRAPHGCHTQYMSNMNSTASLVMAVVVTANNSTRLWGLVVCHHTTRRYVPFPLRYACEFLMQALGLQLNMELQIASQLAEKKILRMQTLLCDMLLRDAPVGIVTQSPNIMDLVKCDGAAMFYGGKCWVLGVTPTEAQIRDIAGWLLTYHGDSTGLSTDSLADAGYPSAVSLGDAVCGMATARIASKDFLFWFRSHTAKEVKWGGAKHSPEDKDDGERMHPRSSFKAFLEVVKSRSFPWEIPELNAIHSLQLIMRGSFQDSEITDVNTLAHVQLNDLDIKRIDELSSVACEMVRLIETATVPILAVDSAGCINGWNAKTAELTGLATLDAMGKSLLDDLVHEESRAVVEHHLLRALKGEEDKNVELKLRRFGPKQHNDPIFILTNACSSRDCTNSIVGVCYVGQDITKEKIVMDKFVRLEGDYKAILHSPNSLIPPIFASDENACCCEWNTAMEKLTGWTREEVIGKMLLGEIFGEFCRLKSQDALTKFMILMYRAIAGQETQRFHFGIFDRQGKYFEVLLTANKRNDMNGKTIGCFCFLQDLVPDVEQVLQSQREHERKYFAILKELTYIRQEIKNPMNGIRFTHQLFETSVVSDDQKQFLKTSGACERQMITIINDMELRSMEEGCVKLKMEGFLLGTVIDAIVSQVMIPLRQKNLQLIHDIPEQIKTLPIYGDQMRLQQVLSDFLGNVVHHTPSAGGWVEIKVSFSSKLVEDDFELVLLEFRMTHPGQGLPLELVQDMTGEGTQWDTPEGLGLSMSNKLLKLMNGHVQYVREVSKCYFLIEVELQSTRKRSRRSETCVTSLA